MITSYTTLSGAVSTSCDDSGSTPSTSAEPSPSSSSSAVVPGVTTAPVQTVTPPSVTLPTSVGALPATSAPEASASTSLRFSTYYSTVIVTDSSGKLSTSTIPVPTLVNGASASSRGSNLNVGAVAGGTAGGVVALILAILLLWLLKKKGCFSRDDDEQLNDDFFRPEPHTIGVIVGPLVTGGDGDDRDVPDDSAMMREKDGRGEYIGEPDATGSHGHVRQSWYGGGEGQVAGTYSHTGGDGGQAYDPRMTGSDGHIYDPRMAVSSEGHAYDPRMAGSDGHAYDPRAVGSDGHAYDPRIADYGAQPYQNPEMESTEYASGALTEYTGGALGRRPSHRQSLHSQGSSSHDGFSNHTAPAAYGPSPIAYPQPLPDLRRNLSGNRLSMGFVEEERRREEFISRSASNASDRSDSAGTAATTGSSQYGISRRPTMGSIDALRSAAGSPERLERPSLEVLNTTASTGTHSPGVTEASLPTSQTNSTSASSYDQPEPSFRRPGVQRNDSDESLLVPSQFLGARIVNATPGEEKPEFDLPLAQYGYVALASLRRVTRD